MHTFYEAVGYMIGAQTDQAVQEHLIEKYMLLPNQVWDSIIQQATKVSLGETRACPVRCLELLRFDDRKTNLFFLSERGHPEGPRDGASAWQHPEDERQGV